MRVVHPFHPLSGRRLVCVGERFNRYGTRVLLQVSKDLVRSVLREWTDLFAPDPDVVMGRGRCLFRIGDLLELTHFIARLDEGNSTDAGS